MASPSPLSRIPVLRILAPFALGIMVHGLWHCWWAPLALITMAVAGYLGLQLMSQPVQQRLRWRPFFMVPIALGSIALGWLCAVVHCPQRLDAEQRQGRALVGRIVSLDYTDFSTRMTMDVLDSDLPRCQVLLTTRGCDYTLSAGDLLTWQAHLNEVENMGNPGEMDYAAYLINNMGIRYQQHLPLEQVKRAGHAPTLLTRMANVRRSLRLMVFQSRLSVGAQRFVTALLLGESGDIDKATRQEFSAAGVAHVLALSGLHVGFITLIIWWLLFPLDYLRLKKLRLTITLAIIFLFAVFTGLSPSVVRATVMIGMVFASFILYRRSVALNALALAALLILVFSPSAIYSVGFQLSFVTVAAVLMLARVPQSLTSRHRWVNYLSSTVITSLVAMLATIALSAHYFHTVSWLSVLSNLLILPVLPVFMVLAALFLLVTAAGTGSALLDMALNAIYRYIHWAVTAVNGIPGAHVSGVYVSSFGVGVYFLVTALVLLWLYRRRYAYLLGAAGALALLLAHSLWLDATTPRQGLVVFNAYSSTPLLYYDHGKGYVWTPDEEDTDSAEFARHYAGFLARQGITGLHFLGNDDSLRHHDAMIKPPLAHLMGQRLLAVGRNKWKSLTTSHPLAIDDIIVTKRFHGTAAKLQELYRFNRLIISGAMQDKQQLLRDCDSLGIAVHDLSSQGAIMLPSP